MLKLFLGGNLGPGLEFPSSSSASIVSFFIFLIMDSGSSVAVCTKSPQAANQACPLSTCATFCWWPSRVQTQTHTKTQTSSKVRNVQPRQGLEQPWRRSLKGRLGNFQCNVAARSAPFRRIHV